MTRSLWTSKSPRTGFRILSINPDLEDDFGHFLAYDRIVRDLAKDEGGDLATLSHTRFSDQSLPWVRPTFRDNSWSLATGNADHYGPRFRRDLHGALEGALVDRRIPTVLFMYTGSVRHIDAVAQVVAERRIRVPSAVSLFYSHQDMARSAQQQSDTEAFFAGWSSQEAAADVAVLADSAELADRIAQLTTHRPGVIPFFSVTRLDYAKTPEPPNEIPVVYAPVNPKLSKGYDLVAGLADWLSIQKEPRPFRLKARVLERPSTDPDILAHVNRVQDKADLVVEGQLSDERYARELGQADALLVPYRLPDFLTRTSAITVDGIALQKPILATKGTWAGDIVEQFGAGEVFRDGDPVDLRAALLRLVDRLPRYRPGLLEAKETWAKRNDPRYLVETLRELARRPRHPRRPTSLLERLMPGDGRS